ncbi:MAG: hypothetical protein ABL865_01725, partial [Candidatus Nitrotoga sp.]
MPILIAVLSFLESHERTQTENVDHNNVDHNKEPLIKSIMNRVADKKWMIARRDADRSYSMIP